MPPCGASRRGMSEGDSRTGAAGVAKPAAPELVVAAASAFAVYTARPTRRPRVNHRLYPLTAALLIVHEIDSAYWREWELLGLPGGVEAFLLIHLPLALLVLWGQAEVAARSRAGFWMSVAVGAAGILTAAIHFAFLLRGAVEFRTPGSLAVIGASALAGLALLASTATASRLPQ